MGPWKAGFDIKKGDKDAPCAFQCFPLVSPFVFQMEPLHALVLHVSRCCSLALLSLLTH